MKNLVLFLALFFLFNSSFSQNTKTAEAEKNLAKAAENVKAEKYHDALLSMSKAKEEILKLFSSQLEAALPKTVENWMENNSGIRNPGMGMPMGQGEISVSRTYSNPTQKKNEPADNQTAANPSEALPAPTHATHPRPSLPGFPGSFGEPSLTITITNNTMWANEVAMAHSNTDNPMPGMEGQSSSPVKISGFRALEKFDKNRKSGSVTVIAGAGVIRVEGNNIENKDLLTKAANAVDYKLVKTVLGE